MRPSLGNTKDEILDAFKALDKANVGIQITEAHIVGTGTLYRWQGDGHLGVVVGAIGLRPATNAEYDELEEALELGEAQIYTRPLWSAYEGRVPHNVLHQATGNPLDENSPAAIRRRNRWARLDQLRNAA